MKKIVLPVLACLALGVSTYADDGKSVKETKQVEVPAEPCFKDHEFQLDVFGSYTDATHSNPHRDGWGGGLGLNYFFIKYVGVGVDGNVYDGGRHTDNAVWDFSGRLIARYPIETGKCCIAPYAFVGGGVLDNRTTVGTFHAGGGLEWRVTHTIGIFTEGRYTWGCNEIDAAQIRAGIRFAF